MKTPVLLLCSGFLLLFACKVDKSNKKINKPYIISKEDSLLEQRWKGKVMPPPPLLIYGDYNFIVDVLENVYLHRKSYPLSFYDTEIDVSKLASIHLDTSDLVLMSQQEIENFLANAALSWDTKRSVVIASFNDTIKAALIYRLINVLRINKTIRRWNIRKATEEETVILKNKIGRR